MLAGLVGILVIGTVIVLLRARDAFYDGDWRMFWRSTALGVPLATVSVVALGFALWYPQLSVWKALTPLGPAWDCQTYGYGEPVCFKH